MEDVNRLVRTRPSAILYISYSYQHTRITRHTQPKSDKSKLPDCHYLDVFATPLYMDENGNARPPDQYQPRANIRKRFENGSLSLNNQDSIDKFCTGALTSSQACL